MRQSLPAHLRGQTHLRGTAVPMPDTTAECTAAHLISRWVANLDAPVVMITDRGTQFESRAWSELLDFLGTRRQLTAAYHPQSSSTIERLFKRLKVAMLATPNDLGGRPSDHLIQLTGDSEERHNALRLIASVWSYANKRYVTPVYLV